MIDLPPSLTSSSEPLTSTRGDCRRIETWLTKNDRVSIQFSVTCLDCGKLAPRLGDGGFLGAPLLAPVAEVDWRGTSIPSFGYLYEPLAGLGIRRYDLEAFREFLNVHDAHRTVLSSDHDAESDYPEELLAIEQAPGFDALIWSEMEAQDAQRARRTENGEFTIATYALTCVECRKTHQASEAELLTSFEPFTVSVDAVSIYLARWAARRADPSWHHRLMGIIDPSQPFLENLGAFLEKHRQHSLEAQLLPLA